MILAFDGFFIRFWHVKSSAGVDLHCCRNDTLDLYGNKLHIFAIQALGLIRFLSRGHSLQQEYTCPIRFDVLSSAPAAATPPA